MNFNDLPLTRASVLTTGSGRAAGSGKIENVAYVPAEVKLG